MSETWVFPHWCDGVRIYELPSPIPEGETVLTNAPAGPAALAYEGRAVPAIPQLAGAANGVMPCFDCRHRRGVFTASLPGLGKVMLCPICLKRRYPERRIGNVVPAWLD